MARKHTQLLYIGASGKVLAIDIATGAEIWRTKLKSSGTVLLHRDSTHLFATVSGELFCLDPDNGGVRWHNKLKGLGLGLVSMATTEADAAKSSAYVPIAEQLRQRAAHTSHAV